MQQSGLAFSNRKRGHELGASLVASNTECVAVRFIHASKDANPNR